MTEIVFTRGLWIVVLPAYVVGPLVDIVVDFKPWPNGLFATILAKWNVAWNSIDVKTTINVIDCRKKPPRHTVEIPPPARLPPRGNPCTRGFLQPDGRCGLPVVLLPPPALVPPPPRLCADGRGPDAAGRCPLPPGSTTALLPVEPPPVIVPLPPPPGGGAPLPACRPGQIREPDGRCRRPVIPLPTIVPVIPEPPRDPRPPIIGKLLDGPGATKACDLLAGVARRRCFAGQRGDGGAKAVTVEVHGDSAPPKPTIVAPPTTPVRTRPPVFRPPVFQQVSHPVARPVLRRPVVTAVRRPRPVIARPVHVRPAHVVTRRPSVRRPTFRPSRPAFRPARPTFHPAARPPRPQVRSAPRRPPPRGGGGRRRR